MWRDPLVQEIRAIRESNAERFGYDLRAIYRDLKKLEQQSGRLIVSPPQRSPASPALTSKTRTSAKHSER
jgi:hypothetical protein